MSDTGGKDLIGLTLSGGGSRAIAFHLGCMRALNQIGVLPRITVISAVSGGSILAGMYAYFSGTFEEFDGRVVRLLRRGLQWSTLRHLLSLKSLAFILVTNMISVPTAMVAGMFNKRAPLRRWASRTDAFEQALKDIFAETKIGQLQRPDLKIVFNACELRTGSAFRFADGHSGGWRFGLLKDNDVSLAHAVACSAAYPLFLPAFDHEYTFLENGATSKKRVLITDGGIYDNLGISCLEPNNDNRYNLHVYATDYIICCNAGHGQLSGNKIPFGIVSRVHSSLENVFRKAQDAAVKRLHMYRRDGQIKGFVLPYLGQQDMALPLRPPDFVRREEVVDYPTNFAAMNQNDIELLARRGEQLTRILMNHYCPELGHAWLDPSMERPNDAHRRTGQKENENQ